MVTANNTRSAGPLRRWRLVHTWTSLICTVFLLMLCITGLPLIFHHELEPWLGKLAQPRALPETTPQLSLDRVLDAARASRPGDHVHLVFTEAGEREAIYVGMGETPAAPFADDIGVFLDWRTGEILGQQRFGEGGILDILLKLHIDMFAGLPGKLFLGLMAFLFLVALVSGIVLYAPFLRGRRFGAVRRDRGPRLAWIDLHNAIGVVTVCWALVVGATGMLNTWADLLLKLWQFDELAAMTAPFRDQPPPAAHASFAESVAAARSAAPGPGYEFAFAAFPGTAFAGDHHYAVFLRGNEPLTSRLLFIALIDAASGAVTEARSMPWYISALLLSQPLHFGDYGGLPLKIVWAILDVLTIVVLASGVYLWWKRLRKGSDTSEAALERERSSEQPRGGGRRVVRAWPVPVALGAVSIAGLLAALLADGLGDVMSWFALGGVAAMALYVLCARPARPS